MEIDKNKLFFMEELAKYGLLNQFIKNNLLEKRLEKIFLSEEEFLKAKVNYKKMNRIDSEEDLNLHMKKKLYSEKALKYNIELPLKIHKYCP